MAKFQIYYLSISHYASVSTRNSIFIFGGWIDEIKEEVSSIAEYSDDSWAIIGHLQQARDTHQAILIDSKVIIIGGLSDLES